MIEVTPELQARWQAMIEKNRQDFNQRLLSAGIDRVILVGAYTGNFQRSEFKDLDRPDEHWFTTPDRVLKGFRAPVKPYGGYKTSKPGVLYVLYSEEEGLFKIGITNDFESRLAQLIKGTYFNFQLYGKLSCEDGKLISDLETYVHQLLKEHNAGLGQWSGVNGASEWFKDTEEVRKTVESILSR